MISRQIAAILELSDMRSAVEAGGVVVVTLEPEERPGRPGTPLEQLEHDMATMTRLSVAFDNIEEPTGDRAIAAGTAQGGYHNPGNGAPVTMLVEYDTLTGVPVAPASLSWKADDH